MTKKYFKVQPQQNKCVRASKRCSANLQLFCFGATVVEQAPETCSIPILSLCHVIAFTINETTAVLTPRLYYKLEKEVDSKLTVIKLAFMFCH